MESENKALTAVTLDSVLINRLRMKQLALLCSLDSSHNLHQAAEMIHVSQPSATKMLQEIERAFGFEIFERHPRGITPTDLGREVLRYATQTLSELEHFANDLTIKRGGGYGHLVIGAIMAAAPDLLAHAVLRLKSRHPLIQVQILGETSDQILPMLEQRKLDLAVGRFSSPLQHNLFDFEELKREKLIFVARAGHPLCQREKLELYDLADWPWTLQPLPNPTRILLEKEFSAHGMATPANTVECSSIFAILQLLQYGDSVALIPEPVVRDHLRAKLLCKIPLQIDGQLPVFGILTRRGSALRPTAQAFIDALRAVVADSKTKKQK
jgi:DNA-binding transcriptional LysR family regulator